MFRSCIYMFAASLLITGTLHAQAPDAPADSDSAAFNIAPIEVNAKRVKLTPVQTQTLQVTASVSAKRAEETVNVIDTEDAVKYQPSVFLRKRNNGDTQAVMGTRVWGTGSSARSLIFADGVPITALIANNNTIGGPRWGLVSPAEIERIDMMYGPYSAAYSGNSMGAVMEITTRLPQKLEASVNQTQALQTFDLYGTSKDFATTQTTANVGDRFGKFAFWTSMNYQRSNSQPLSYVTNATFPNGTTGGFTAQNKLGAPANIIGASGLLHTDMVNAKFKAAYDITPVLRAAYTFGYWTNDANSSVDTYAENTSGQPTFAGLAGFASGNYGLDERHSSHSLSLRSNSAKDWDWEAVATRYDFNKDKQRAPLTASASGTNFGSAGRVAMLDGTNWQTADLKGIWHKGGIAATHSVSFGAHIDRYELSNPTYNTPDWTTGDVLTTVATEGDGKTRTAALWAQDSWRMMERLKFTFGVRYEDWRGYDGFNANGNTKVNQPVVTGSRFSPKATLLWNPTADWTVNASVGKAYRFATASELYQLVSTGTTFTSPDPNLKPDNDVSTELRVERQFQQARLQVALFQDDVHDAIISQFLPLVPNSPTLFSVVSNVDHVRGRGVEVVGAVNDVLVKGLEVSANVTYVDAKTLAISGRASATAPAGSAIGKRLPNIPDWRFNFVTSYRHRDRLAVTLAGRYSGKIYSTLDNSDVNPNTYQGFSEWFVADAHVNYRLNHHVSAGVGVDNLLNRKYFLFHPFPQRTFVGNLKLAL